jgi:ribosomal protein S21
MIAVTVRGDDISGAIRRLRIKVERSGLKAEMKRHEYHRTRSERKKEKARIARKKSKQRERRETLWKELNSGYSLFSPVL